MNKMKNRIISSLLAGTILMTTGGCSLRDKNDDNGTNNIPNTIEDYDNDNEVIDDVINDDKIIEENVLPIGDTNIEDDMNINKEDNTITCEVVYNITEEEYVDGVYTINEEFNLNLVFKDIDTDIVVNKVTSNIILDRLM